MERPKGFLLVTMEPPAALEEEFHDWYDTEHIPCRAAIPGFESAQRFVAVSGWPRYMAFYDLTTIDVLESEAYRKVAWSGFSPWAKRMLPKVHGQYRANGEQIYPGRAVTGKTTRLLLLRFSEVPDSEADLIRNGALDNYSGRAETRQIRILRSNYDHRIDYIAMIEARAPIEAPRINLAAFGAAAEHLDMVNEYVPYWRHGPLPGIPHVK